ncbi:MAG: hypothetical protein IJZ36_00700, partial [Bacilli bacterium]|nr:hypothetical protein [Bacilli bacterium]
MKKKFGIKRILAFILVLTQIATHLSIPAIAEEIESDDVIVEDVVVDEEVIVDEAIVEEPIVDEPIVDEPIVDEAIVEEPIVEDLPIVENPVIEDTVLEEQQDIQEEVIDENQSNEDSVVEEAVLYTVKVIDTVTNEVLVETELTEGSDYDLSSVTVVEHEGYVFDGYYVNDTKLEGIYTLSTENVDIEARYSVIEKESETEVITYSVKVISNVDNSVIYESDLEENAEFDLTTLTVTEVEGYTFDGFYIAEEKVESVNVSADIEIVAKYVEVVEEVEDTVFEERTDNGLSLVAEVGVVPAGTAVVSEQIEDTSVVYELLLEELNNDLELVDEKTFAEVTNLKVYDITLESEGVSVQPNGNVDITVDFEIAADKKYFAYYVNGAEVERLNCEVVANGVKFSTNH